MSSQKENEQKETTMPIFTGFPPDGGFATDAGEETCECEKNDKDFSHRDLGSKVDDPKFHGPSTDGEKKRFLLDKFGDPIRCKSCGKLVVDSSATSGYDRVSFGDSATAGETSIHLNENGVPEKCENCNFWVLNRIKHNQTYFPDDVKVPPYCHSDPSKTEIESCYLCGFPKIDGSVHHTDPTKPCDPSCYADGTKHLVDETGRQIECPGCLQSIKDPRKHNRVPYLDIPNEYDWLCTESPESMMSSASGGFQVDPI